MPYPLYKFNGAKFLESGKSSFRFLHVHSHTDTVNYIHVLQQLVYDIVNLVTLSLLNVLIRIIRFVLEPIGFACVTLEFVL